MRQRVHGGNLVWAAAIAGCPETDILDFSASISPLGPPHSSLAAISSKLGYLKHYPDPNYSELRLALSHFHQVPPEWILPGNGSAELLTYIGREFSQFAATALITPAFGDYYRALAAYDVRVLEFPFSLAKQNNDQKQGDKEDREKISFAQPLSSLPVMLSNLSLKHGLLLNNPHNPTGTLWSRQAILPYLEELPLVVVDEAFMDFLPPDKEQSLIEMVEKYPNLVILRSLTKFYSMAGLRLGYAIAHPDYLRRWEGWRDPWSVNTLAAAAAVAALADRDFQLQTWEWLAPTRYKLFQGLSSLPRLDPLPGAANFLLVRAQHSVTQLQEQLLKKHQILIRNCQSFPELGDNYFRVAVLRNQDNQRLIKALSLVLSES